MVIFHGYVKLPKANKTTHRESASITRIVKEKVRCKLFALVACQVRLKGLDAERSHGVPQHQSIQNHTHQFLFGPRFLTHLAMAQNYQPPIAGWFSYSTWSFLWAIAIWGWFPYKKPMIPRAQENSGPWRNRRRPALPRSSTIPWPASGGGTFRRCYFCWRIPSVWDQLTVMFRWVDFIVI